MAQCTAKSKQTGEQCKQHASVGKTKCRFHGGATPKKAKKHGFDQNREEEKKILDYKPDLSTDDVSDSIKVLEKQLMIALARQTRYMKAQELYLKEREGTGDRGLELTEVKRTQSDPGKEMTTLHRKRDFSTEINTVTNLINRITKTIDEIKRGTGPGNADTVTFDINFGGGE